MKSDIYGFKIEDNIGGKIVVLFGGNIIKILPITPQLSDLATILKESYHGIKKQYDFSKKFAEMNNLKFIKITEKMWRDDQY